MVAKLADIPSPPKKIQRTLTNISLREQCLPCLILISKPGGLSDFLVDGSPGPSFKGQVYFSLKLQKRV